MPQLVNSYSMGISTVRHQAMMDPATRAKPGTIRVIEGKEVWFPPEKPPKMAPNPVAWVPPPMKPALAAPQKKEAVHQPEMAPAPVQVVEKASAPTKNPAVADAQPEEARAAMTEADDIEVANAAAVEEVKKAALAKQAQKEADAKETAEAKKAEEATQAEQKMAEAKKAEDAKAKANAEEAAKPKRPDMNGKWLNTEIDGDIEKFFKDGVGLPWAMRKTMAGTLFKPNKLTHEMGYNADYTEETIIISMRPDHEMTKTIDASKTEAKIRDNPKDDTGKVTQYKCYWDGEAVVTEDPSGQAFETKRYLKGNKMHLELYFSNKPQVAPVKRIFTQQ